MKLTLTIILILISTISFGQTKKETIEWINSKVPENAFIFGKYFKQSRKLEIYPDGTFTLTVKYYESPLNEFKPKVETISIAKGNFKNFNPSSVQVSYEKSLIFISINCYNNTSCLTNSQSGRSGIDLSTTGITFGAFDNDEDDIADRLKKAFKHLITLSGGKKEAF